MQNSGKNFKKLLDKKPFEQDIIVYGWTKNYDYKVVSSIGVGAFQNETRLRLVNLPKQLKYIKKILTRNGFCSIILLVAKHLPKWRNWQTPRT